MTMKMENILVSQAIPRDLAPYEELTKKYGVKFSFRPFFLIKPLTSREFRAQRVDILAYTAIVFSARHTIDAFFEICDELRIKIPDTMKYFCTTEAVAVYLQKHIVFRKRKVFFGTGTPDSVLALVTARHKDEKFLITTTESSKNEQMANAFEKAGLKYDTAAFVKPVSQDLHDVDLSAFDMLVFYNPFDLRSLKENFPDFKQGNLKFLAYGKHIAAALEEEGIEVAIHAPTPEAPSVAAAVEQYLQKNG